MPRDARGPAHERPIRVQPAGRTGARHRFAASPVRPHVYYRPTPRGRRVTIVNVEPLTADERADIAEAADNTEVPDGSAEGGRWRVHVSPSLEADAVYVEHVATPPTLLLRPDRSPEHAVVAVMYCVPGMTPLAARRLVDAHLPGDGALSRTASAAESTSRARAKPRRARTLLLSALAGATALVAVITADGPDGPSTPGVSTDLDRASSEALPARSAERMAAQPRVSPSAQAGDRASESVSAEVTPNDDPLGEDTSDDDSAPEPTREEDDGSSADTSADSTSEPTTSSGPTRSSEPSESPSATEPGDSGTEQDESDEPGGLLGVIADIFD